MKLKSILFAAGATLLLTTATVAQVPNYVPKNGLLSWWPFNGNANDESGNNNNGTVIGATLTNDRFGKTNCAYSFNGVDNYISVNYIASFNNSQTFTISLWVKVTNKNAADDWAQYLFSRGADTSPGSVGLAICQNPHHEFQGLNVFYTFINGEGNAIAPSVTESIPQSNWHHLLTTYDGLSVKLYINGTLVKNNPYTKTLSISNSGLLIGKHITSPPYSYHVNGNLDDIGIWNRALTQQEVTNLYNASNCANNTTITPQTNSLSIGSSAAFTASTSDPSPTYVWQSDFGQGYVTLNNYGNYSGVNTAKLNIANVQLPNHTQHIRVISTSNTCIDTSDVAVINILDTCIVTVYDTQFTTVTDTLIIDANFAKDSIEIENLHIKVYPNPTNNKILIDVGDPQLLYGCKVKLFNSISQLLIEFEIRQQNYQIDLWRIGAKGLYHLSFYDTNGNLIASKKIILD